MSTTTSPTVIREIRTSSLPLGYYYRNRSGYEGSYFMVEGDEFSSISYKSNEYKEKALLKPEKFPVVLMKNMTLNSLIETSEGFVARYYSYSGATPSGLRSLINWYRRNGLTIKGVGIDSEAEELIINGIKF